MRDDFDPVLRLFQSARKAGPPHSPEAIPNPEANSCTTSPPVAVWPLPEPETPPPGFITRVLASTAALSGTAATPRLNPWERAWERLAIGSLPIAAAIALASLWIGERHSLESSNSNSNSNSNSAEHKRIALAFLQSSLEP